MESFNNGEEKPKRKYPLLVAENAFSNVGTAASCPICNKVVHGDNAAFNTHIDICMNAKAIKSMDNPVYGSVESNPLKLVYKQPNIDDEWKIFKKLSDRISVTSGKMNGSSKAAYASDNKKKRKEIDWNKQIVELREKNEKSRQQYHEMNKNKVRSDYSESVRDYDADTMSNDYADQPVLDISNLDQGYEDDHKVKQTKLNFTIDKSKLFDAPVAAAQPTKPSDNQPQFKYDYNDYNPNRNRSIPLTESLIEVNIDSFLEEVLGMKLGALAADHVDDLDAANEVKNIPNRFIHEKHYISLFQPLLMEEVKAALVSYVHTGRAYEQHKEKRHVVNHRRDKLPSLFVNPIENASITDILSEIRVEKVVSDVVNTSAAENRYESTIQKDDIVVILKQ
jgi:hypothetical protein